MTKVIAQGVRGLPTTCGTGFVAVGGTSRANTRETNIFNSRHLASIVPMQEEHRESTRPEFLPSSLATHHQELGICRHRETKIFIHNAPGLHRADEETYHPLF